jgi:hypothetical protein
MTAFTTQSFLVRDNDSQCGTASICPSVMRKDSNCEGMTRVVCSTTSNSVISCVLQSILSPTCNSLLQNNSFWNHDCILLSQYNRLYINNLSMHSGTLLFLIIAFLSFELLYCSFAL